MLRAVVFPTQENSSTRKRSNVLLAVLLKSNQPTKLDAVWMRLDFLRKRRKLFCAAAEVDLFALGIAIGHRHMRIGDGGLPQIRLNQMRALLVMTLKLDLD